MKLRNILIIFLFALFLTIIIYKINSNEKKKKILILGDNYLLELTDLNYIKLLDKNYIVNNNFTDKNKNYIGIYNDIVDNRCIYNKGKKECINNEILSSDIIVINSDNKKYFSKCNKSNRIKKEYNLSEYNNYIKIKNIIKKISNAELIIIGNYCSLYDEEIANYLKKLYISNSYIDTYDLYNKYKDDFEYYIYKVLISKK